MSGKSNLLLFIALLLCGCSSGVQTDRPYQEIGRAEHFTLVEPGYVIGIEKKDKKIDGLLDGSDIKVPYSSRFGAENNSKLKSAFEANTIRCQSKVMVATQLVKSIHTNEVAYNRYFYNAYKDGLEGKPNLEKSFNELELLFADFQNELKTAEDAKRPFTHVLVMSMGWNNDQAESLWRYNKILKNLRTESSKQKDVEFRPLVIAFTWPSVWGSLTDSTILRTSRHLASYINKSSDADEIGFTWANWVVNSKIPEAISSLKRTTRPKVVLIGHSFGARVLSRALFSGEVIKSPKTRTSAVDIFIGLQGAFSARRFVAGEGIEGAPYAQFSELPTRIVLTSSTNDTANLAALWSAHVGGGWGLKYAEKHKTIFNVREWKKDEEDFFDVDKNFTQGSILTINATSIVNNCNSEKMNAHNDILDDEMGRLLWRVIR